MKDFLKYYEIQYLKDMNCLGKSVGDAMTSVHFPYPEDSRHVIILVHVLQVFINRRFLIFNN